MVRVLVTVGALVERNAHVLRLAVRPVGVALGTLHLGVQAGQGIACLRVIKLGLTGLADIDRLPIHEIVALLAIRTQAAFVLIFMAGNAAGRQTEVGSARVLDFDGRAFLGRDVGRIVALVTGQARVLAFQQVSRFLVIERLDVPLDQREVFPVVLRVATGTFLTGARRDVIGGVQAFMSGKPGRDFGVTVQALQRRLAAELVATGAVGRSVQRLMRPREWSGRDLRRSRGQQPTEACEEERCRNGEPNGARSPLPDAHCHCILWRFSNLPSPLCLAAHHALAR